MTLSIVGPSVSLSLTSTLNLHSADVATVVRVGLIVSTHRGDKLVCNSLRLLSVVYFGFISLVFVCL